jgi:hypothetical protein
MSVFEVKNDLESRQGNAGVNLLKLRETLIILEFLLPGNRGQRGYNA